MYMKYLFFLLFVCIFLILYQKHIIEEGFENKKMDDQLDMLTYSRFSPSCCPSTYTSTTGCLCDDFNERDFIRNRGGNSLAGSCSS